MTDHGAVKFDLVLWVQTGLCFIGWVIAGFAFNRLLHRTRWPFLVRYRMSGALFLVLGLAVLAGGVSVVINFSGISQGSLRPLAWFVVLLTGILFVGFQVLGAHALLIHILPGETRHQSQPSVPQEDSQ